MLSVPRSIAMLALSAVLVLAAMPTGDLGWPIWVALAPACVALRAMSWRRRLLWGFALGWLIHMVLFRWIIFSLREMSNLPDAVGLLALTLFSIWHAAPLALFAWLGVSHRICGLRKSMRLIAVADHKAARIVYETADATK